MHIIRKYFPDLSDLQYEQLDKLRPLYSEWNSRINLISRKDIDNLYMHHILHSLAIAKVVQFKTNTLIMDAGTGGGLPGIPLAILFPDSTFHLIDSVNKKIMVVKSISETIDLKNVVTQTNRIEQVNMKFDFIVSRAVSSLPVFYQYVKNKINKKSFNDIPNGILYLKGGDFSEELKGLNKRFNIYEIDKIFTEEYYKTKKLIHIY